MWRASLLILALTLFVTAANLVQAAPSGGIP